MTELDLCPTTGKVMRLSVEWARVSAFLASRRSGDRIVSYLCPDCGTHHLSNSTKREAKISTKQGHRVVLAVVREQPPPAPVVIPWGTPQQHDLLHRLGRLK